MIRLAVTFQERGLERFIEGVSLEAFTDAFEAVLRERGLRTFRRNMPRAKGELRRALRLDRKGNTLTVSIDRAIAPRAHLYRWRRSGPVGFPHVQQILNVVSRRNLRRWIDDAIRRQTEALEQGA